MKKITLICFLYLNLNSQIAITFSDIFNDLKNLKKSEASLPYLQEVMNKKGTDVFRLELLLHNNRELWRGNYKKAKNFIKEMDPTIEVNVLKELAFLKSLYEVDANTEKGGKIKEILNKVNQKQQ